MAMIIPLPHCQTIDTFLKSKKNVSGPPPPPSPAERLFLGSRSSTETFCPPPPSKYWRRPCDRVGLNVVGWGWGKRWDTSYTAQTHIIVINYKFIRPSAISMLGDFSLCQNVQPILAQPIFHTLYKSGQCSPKHELFSNVLVS